jgi:branched-chain amino acid transport system permease protein
MVVLYRATGVLNLAFGATGAMGALIAWQLINKSGVNQWLAYLVCVVFGGVVTLAYGLVFGRALAGREPLVKAAATLGLTLILLGVMDLLWTSSGGASRSITLPTDNNTFNVGQIQVEITNVIALALGVPVRRVEASAWFGCGILSGIAGVLLADLVALDATTLTFLVLSTLAATLIARLRSIGITFAAAIVVGLVTSLLTPINSVGDYRDMTPFVLAAAALLFLNRRRVISLTSGGV